MARARMVRAFVTARASSRRDGPCSPRLWPLCRKRPGRAQHTVGRAVKDRDGPRRSPEGRLAHAGRAQREAERRRSQPPHRACKKIFADFSAAKHASRPPGNEIGCARCRKYAIARFEASRIGCGKDLIRFRSEPRGLRRGSLARADHSQVEERPVRHRNGSRRSTLA